MGLWVWVGLGKKGRGGWGKGDGKRGERGVVAGSGAVLQREAGVAGSDGGCGDACDASVCWRGRRIR